MSRDKHTSLVQLHTEKNQGQTLEFKSGLKLDDYIIHCWFFTFALGADAVHPKPSYTGGTSKVEPGHGPHQSSEGAALGVMKPCLGHPALGQPLYLSAMQDGFPPRGYSIPAQREAESTYRHKSSSLTFQTSDSKEQSRLAPVKGFPTLRQHLPSPRRAAC